MGCWVGEERISEIVSLISGYGSLKEEVHENICWGESAGRYLYSQYVAITQAGDCCWLLVVDILLLLVNIALAVVCHMKLTVLEWLSSLITYILPY